MALPPVPIRSALFIAARARSDVALRQILLSEFSVMAFNEARLLRAHDVECLHDYRVAMRRCRIILTRVPAVFPLREMQRFAAHWSRLNEVTGPCRDLDVLLQHWKEYATTTDAGCRQVHDYIQQRSQQARRDIVIEFNSSQYAEFKNQWHDFLSVPTVTTRMRNAKLPIAELTVTVLDAVFHKLLKRLKAIKPSSADSKFHKLRIMCKRLRYLLDYFLFPVTASVYKTLIPELKKLQNSLGKSQDLAVQQTMLLFIEQKMQADGLLQPEASEALGTIRKLLRKRAIKQRVSAMKSIKKFLRRATHA